MKYGMIGMDMEPEEKVRDHNDLEDGFIHLGSPDDHPVGDSRKPNQEGLSAPESRLHGGDTGFFCCDHPYARTRE